MNPGMREAHGLPGLGLIGAELLGSRRSFAVAKTAPAGFQESGIGRQIQFGIFADPSNTNGMGRNLFQHCGVGVAAVEGEQQTFFLCRRGPDRGTDGAGSSVERRAH